MDARVINQLLGSIVGTEISEVKNELERSVNHKRIKYHHEREITAVQPSNEATTSRQQNKPPSHPIFEQLSGLSLVVDR